MKPSPSSRGAASWRYLKAPVGMTVAEALTEALTVWAPPPDLTVSEWADRFRVLSPEASAEPGKWDTSRAEYQRGIMDAVADPSVETVVVIKSAQVGWTEILNNVAGYHIDQDPAPMLVVQPTLEMGETWSKDRLAPMLRDSPALAGKVKDARARDSGNTLLHKSFPGGHITIAGANSPSSLASRPIRIVLCDEIDRYPLSAGSEGDPVSLASKRATTFWNRKRLLGSTPTIAGVSRIEAAYEASDQRRYFVPCPKCNEFQTLVWERVEWDKDETGKHLPETAKYTCGHCGTLWSDAQRWRAVSRGEWRATAEFTGTAGFHLNELYSSWVRLTETVKGFLEAKNHPEQLKTWWNTALGLTWTEQGEVPPWERLYERREEYRIGTVPAGALFLTAGGDVQRDRIEVDVWGWGRGGQRWLVDHRVLWGDTGRPEVWTELTRLIGESWPHEGGTAMRLLRAAVDTGFETANVYAWSRQHPEIVLPVKGVEAFDRSAPVSGPTWVDATEGGVKIRRGAKLWTVAAATFKSELYGGLRAERPTDEEIAAGKPHPPGYVHLSRGVDSEWIKQLVSEQLVAKVVKGRRRYEWQKVRDRNEALDCAVYARAAAWVAGYDRMDEEDFAARETELKPVAATPPPPPPPARDDWLGGRGRDWFGGD